MIINKRFVAFLPSFVVLTIFSWSSTPLISFASIKFGYVPNATISFSLLKNNKNNNFNINFNLGNNFYLKLNDKISLFAGVNIGMSGILSQNNKSASMQYTSINIDDNFKYIKNEYPNAETYANEIRSDLINQANENIEANSTAIDNYMQNYGDYLFLDPSESKTSPLNINYEAIKSDVNNDIFFNNNIYLDKHINDDYINWDEAIAIYHTIVNDGNNENAKIYAQLMTGLKDRPADFNADPYNILLTDDGKQQLYAIYDRVNIIKNNNQITQSIINNDTIQSKIDIDPEINDIRDVIRNNKISAEEIRNLIQDVTNNNRIIALKDNNSDGYTSWNEAVAEYQAYIDNINEQCLAYGIDDTVSESEAQEEAKQYAMIITGLTGQPTSYDEDPYVILETERQEFSDGQNTANENSSINNNTLTHANQVAEKIVDKYSFRERFNFSVPIGVNVKINEKVSIEPYWLVGFNVAQANVMQNNSSTRLTKVGFAAGLGTRALFCKELFFIGLEYRFAQNMFEKTKIQSHNINLSMGVRFNFATLANLIK